MFDRVRTALVSAACCAALLLLSACGGNEPKLVSNQTTPPASNSQGGNSAQTVVPAQSAQNPAGKVTMGEYIDTSPYDARIKQAEEQAKKRPDDKGMKKRLAQAYLERGNALTQARQYQPALGDYRRALKLDPENQEAQYWSQTIIGIMQQMKREVPAEGTEPTPIRQ